jgi:hypothetical protein
VACTPQPFWSRVTAVIQRDDDPEHCPDHDVVLGVTSYTYSQPLMEVCLEPALSGATTTAPSSTATATAAR